MTLTRRDVLRLGVGAAIALPLGACMPDEATQTDTVGEVEFGRPLAIPPLAESHVDADGRRVFDLAAQAGKRRFVRGKTTDTWGLNGDYLGPTLRAKRGEQVLINVHNKLREPTTLHWHGMHLPASADGGPHQTVEPGKTWSPTWRIDQPAATLWYHPHPHGRTEKHVYRGMAGMFIVEDDVESRLDLPREYGVDDIPVVVQDKRFRGNGQFDEGEHRATGLLGDTLLVNGTIGPYQRVGTERIRLRLLNGSTARVYSFGFSDDRRFSLIGSDGGLLTAPVETDRIQLSPAERAEIVVSMKPNERVVLRSYPPDLGTNVGVTRIAGGRDSFDVLELQAGSSLVSSPPVPDRLVDVPRLEPAESATTRNFVLVGRTINGKKMRMDRIDEVVTVDTTEIWQVTNQHPIPHSFHVHDVQFQILSVGGASPPPQLRGWKDTVFLPPRVPIRLIMRFADYADPVMPYMYHCHLLFHEDAGMMGQFVVVEPGQQAGAPGGAGGQEHDGHGQ